MNDMFTINNKCLGFPDTSVGKESANNAGDTSLNLGSQRSAGEGLGYTLQYSWASPVAQLVKNLPAMLEIWVQSLGLDDPLEKGMASVFWPGEFLNCIVHDVTKIWTQLCYFHFTKLNNSCLRSQQSLFLQGQ